MSEATLDEFRAAARGLVKPDRALLRRAAAGREAVQLGADPALTLALVVWPSEELVAVSSIEAGDGRGRWMRLRGRRPSL